MKALRLLTLMSVIAAIPAQSERDSVVGRLAGRLVGTLDDASLAQRVGVSVRVQRQGDEERWTSVGSDGAFAITDLPPGEYTVGLRVYSDCPCQDPPRRLAPRRPLLGGGVSPRVKVRIDAGVAVTIELPTPRLGEVRGRVVAGGRPAAGVHVFAPLTDTMDIAAGSIDDLVLERDNPHAHKRRPCCITDADGEFAFATMAPGPRQLHLRHPESPLSAGPFPVADDRGDATPRLTLELPEARVRGRYQAAERQRGQGPFKAYLFRRALAGADPFSVHELQEPQTWSMQAVELAADGAFEFAWLPAGDFVLRIVGDGGGGLLLGSIDAQRCLRTDGHGLVDLGELGRASDVDATLACGRLPPPKSGFAVRVQALPDDDGLPVFRCSRWIENGRLDLSGIEAGRYRLQQFAPEWFSGTRGLLGSNVGEPVVIEVGADGKSTPPHVF